MRLFLQLKIACHNAHILKIYNDSSLKCPAFVFLSSTLYALYIEAKRNFINNNKGKITFNIFPWDRISLKMVANKAVKYLGSRNQSI